MGKRKDLSKLGKDQIVMARRPGQSISRTAAHMQCSQSAVVSIYQKWSKEGTVVNRWQGHGSLMHMGSEGWPEWSNPTDELMLLKVDAGSDRKVSEYTVHHSLLCMGLRRRRQAGGGSVMIWAMLITGTTHTTKSFSLVINDI